MEPPPPAKPSFPPPPARSVLAPLPTSSFPEASTFVPPPPSAAVAQPPAPSAAEANADADALRAQLEAAESERVKLALRCASLTAERDNYLQGLTKSAQELAAEKRDAQAASDAHDQQRKEDTKLFQENLSRLLEEKAKLHEDCLLYTSPSPRDS